MSRSSSRSRSKSKPSSIYPRLAQWFAVVLVVAAGYGWVATAHKRVEQLPAPELAASLMDVALGVDQHWDPALLGQLSASHAERWRVVPTAWRRMEKGWAIGGGERLELGNWHEPGRGQGFALVYLDGSKGRCAALAELLVDAFDEVAINGQVVSTPQQGHRMCAEAENRVVFYRNRA